MQPLIPMRQNPFATRADIPQPELTAVQKAAITASNKPSEQNPFATKADLPEPELTPEQKAAVARAVNPSGSNPFVTQSALPPIPAPQLSPDQKAAVEAANKPARENPFVTQTDVQPLMQFVTRAAGCINLTANDPAPITFGNLRITQLDVKNGRFTLTFNSYQQSRQNHYIVHALTVHDHPTTLNRIYNVELVRFEKDGFTLHMSRFPGGQAALAPHCMVEVREIL